MNLRELLGSQAVPSIELDDLVEHTGEVVAGCGFVAVADNDQVRNQHAQAAARGGAAAILVDAEQAAAMQVSVPVVAVTSLAQVRGQLAARFYGDPSRQLVCTAVTGTNGKTSIAYHLANLTDLLAGTGTNCCGYSGTLGWGLLDALQDPGLTTSNPVAMQRRLAAVRQLGASHAAVEVSSHALAQRRVDAVHFKTAIFTNLTRDHLDYHGTMEAYARAKARLFTEFDLQHAIICTASAYGAELAQMCSAPVVTYGPDGDVSWQTQKTDHGLVVRWTTPWGSCEAQLDVVADFAVANITAAMIAALIEGANLQHVAKLLPGVRPVPGRLQVVRAASPGRPTVVVDYAHTPDALQQVLSALRGFCDHRLICVVGCGGDRDKGKRPMMAGAAVQHADSVWLTSDNPRTEDPEEIIHEMRTGLDGLPAYVCVDRGEAICRALHEAGAGDVVLIAGKGHEDYQDIKGVKHPFSDVQIATKILEGMV